MYQVRVTVKSVKGFCAAGYKPGDFFTIDRSVILTPGEPKGLCIYAIGALLPYLTAYCRETSSDDWINLKRELQCPDNSNTVIFGLERSE